MHATITYAMGDCVVKSTVLFNFCGASLPITLRSSEATTPNGDQLWSEAFLGGNLGRRTFLRRNCDAHNTDEKFDRRKANPNVVRFFILRDIRKYNDYLS